MSINYYHLLPQIDKLYDKYLCKLCDKYDIPDVMLSEIYKYGYWDVCKNYDIIPSFNIIYQYTKKIYYEIFIKFKLCKIDIICTIIKIIKNNKIGKYLTFILYIILKEYGIVVTYDDDKLCDFVYEILYINSKYRAGWLHKRFIKGNIQIYEIILKNMKNIYDYKSNIIFWNDLKFNMSDLYDKYSNNDIDNLLSNELYKYLIYHYGGTDGQSQLGRHPYIYYMKYCGNFGTDKLIHIINPKKILEYINKNNTNIYKALNVIVGLRSEKLLKQYLMTGIDLNKLKIFELFFLNNLIYYTKVYNLLIDTLISIKKYPSSIEICINNIIDFTYKSNEFMFKNDKYFTEYEIKSIPINVILKKFVKYVTENNITVVAKYYNSKNIKHTSLSSVKKKYRIYIIYILCKLQEQGIKIIGFDIAIKNMLDDISHVSLIKYLLKIYYKNGRDRIKIYKKNVMNFIKLILPYYIVDGSYKKIFNFIFGDLEHIPSYHYNYAIISCQKCKLCYIKDFYKSNIKKYIEIFDYMKIFGISIDSRLLSDDTQVISIAELHKIMFYKKKFCEYQKDCMCENCREIIFDTSDVKSHILDFCGSLLL